MGCAIDCEVTVCSGCPGECLGVPVGSGCGHLPTTDVPVFAYLHVCIECGWDWWAYGLCGVDIYVYMSKCVYVHVRSKAPIALHSPEVVI